MKLFDLLFPFKSKASTRKFELPSKKALIIGSNQATLDKLDNKGNIIKKGKATGVHSSELTEAYYYMIDSGMQVELASIRGGLIPLDPFSLWPLVRTSSDIRMQKDEQLQQTLKQSKAIHTLHAGDYDLIYIAGGWAAAYDLEQSVELAKFIEEAYRHKKVLAAVCHGPLGFCSAKKTNGEPLLQNAQVTGVTNRQLKQLAVSFTPKHPEDSLKKAGANYQYSGHFLTDLFASKVVVDHELKMVTGQNQKCAIATVEQALTML